LVVRISCRPAQAVKEVSADRCRFQVAAAASSPVVLGKERGGVAAAGAGDEAGESAGVAGAGGLGLDRVEVAVDGGRYDLAAGGGAGGRVRERDDRHEGPPALM